MDTLKKYLEIQRKENDCLREEIKARLEELFYPLNLPRSTLDKSPPKYSNYISDLCQFEQKVNHKLTEINYELKRFKILNKYPVYKPPSTKNNTVDDSFDDIETLKANSNRLILKLDSLRDNNINETDTKNLNICQMKSEPGIGHEDLEWKFDVKTDCLIDFESSITFKNETSISDVYHDIQSKYNKLCEDMDKNYQKCQENFSYSKLESSCDKPDNTSVDPSVFHDKLSPNTIVSCPSLKVHEAYEFVKAQSQETLGNSESNFEVHDEINLDIRLIDLDNLTMPGTDEKNKWNNKEIEPKTNESTRDNCSEKKSSVQEAEGTVFMKSEPVEVVMPDISEVMWKNIMELGSTKLENPKVTESLEVPSKNEGSSPTSTSVEPRELNLSDDIKIDSDEKFQSTFDLESAKYSDYDTETDSGVLPGSDSSQEVEKAIPIGQHENNSCDSSKTYHFEMSKEGKDVQCSIEVTKNDNIINFLEDQYNDFRKKDNPSNLEAEVSHSHNDADQENCRPSFSAEEKIKKLGLEDRKTLFEKTRKIAELPDLRLKPTGSSVSDTEKLKKIKRKNKKFEIENGTIPRVKMGCVFSHVESPAEFYIHLDTEESKLIDSLNDLITEQYKKTKTPYNSKFEAFEDIERFCCAYVKDDKMYYRVEVVDWIFEKSEKLVLAQLVDYGNIVYVHFKNLRPLTDEFCLLPKLAVRCYFPFLYPPGSTKHNLLTEWPKSSNEALFELSGLSMEDRKPFFKIAHVNEERDVFAVDLQQVNGLDKNTIGQLLIDLGYAVQIILPEDDPMGVLSAEEEIEDLERCDNINEVILGYDPKDEARICKFTRPDGGRCFKRTCKLEHTKFSRGGFTTDKTLTYADALNDLKLPKQGQFVAIKFTKIIDASHYYVNLKSYEEDISRLETIMNDPTNCNNFESFKVLPAHGEIVLVKHWEKRWLRARIRHHVFNEDGKCTGCQVFMVDYGDIIDAPLDSIKQIKTEYLNLPFQAIECVIHQYKDSKMFSPKDIDRFFYENMVYRTFSAKVKAVADMQLCLDILYKERKLGDILVDYGFLEKVNDKLIFPHCNSVIIPG